MTAKIVKKGTSNKNYKALRKTRNMRYFIDAAAEIIRESGLDGITIRNVSDRAGFNSSSLYTHFVNVEQLLAFACLDMMSGYFNDVNEILNRDQMDSLERFLLLWKVYCRHSFAQPSPFSYVFTSYKSDEIVGYYRDYFKFFPEKYEAIKKPFFEVYLQPSVHDQDLQLIHPCVSDGYLSEEDAVEVNDTATILHDGLLWRIVNHKAVNRVDEFVDLFMRLLIQFTQFKLKKQRDLSGI